MSSSIGGITCNTLNWPKGKPFVHSNPYRQPGRDGNGHILGPKYSDPSTVTTTHLVTDLPTADSLLAAAAAICSTVGNIIELNAVGADNTTLDVFFESVRVTKANACVAAGSAGFVVTLSWTVYCPVS